MLSTLEILERTEINSGKTLTRWHQRGLIPPPIIKTHPNGRGKMAFWPVWIVWRIKEVKRLLKNGEPLDKIIALLGTDWLAEEKKWTRRRRSTKKIVENERKRAARDRFSETAAERVYGFLQAIGVQRPGIFCKLENQFADLRLIDQAIDLMHKGFNPVAIITGGKVQITTDFMVSQLLTSKDEIEAILVLPISVFIHEFYAKVESNLPEKPTIGPALIVIDESETNKEERRFTRTGPIEFNLGRKNSCESQA